MRQKQNLFARVWQYIVKHMESSIGLSLVAFAFVVAGAGLVVAHGPASDRKLTASASEASHRSVAIRGVLFIGEGMDIPTGSTILATPEGGSTISAIVDRSGRYMIPTVPLSVLESTKVFINYNIPECGSGNLALIIPPLLESTQYVNRSFNISCK